MTQRDDEQGARRPESAAARDRSSRGRETDPDLLTSEELRFLEEQTDALIELVGYHQRCLPDSSAFDDPRFLTWLAREHADDDPELLTPREIQALSRRMALAARAETLGVHLEQVVPQRRSVEHPGAVSRILDELTAARGAALLDLSVAAGVGRELWDTECETWIPLPAGLTSGQYLALTIAGDSMTPVLREGDVVLVRVATDVAPDTIIVARLPDDGYVVKRVGRITPRWIELTSLNPEFSPIRVARGPGVVLGTVVLRWRERGE